MNLIKISSLLEKIERERPDSFKINKADIIEWIGESLALIGSEKLHERVTYEVEITNKIGKLPNNIYKIFAVYEESGKPLTETRGRFANNTLLNYRQYFINKGHIQLNYETTKIKVDSLNFYVDENGHPMILDNQYLMEALCSFVLYKSAKKEWIKNNLTTDKYREFEGDWEYYAAAIQSKLNTPTMDEMREFDALHNIGTEVVREGGSITEHIPVITFAG